MITKRKLRKIDNILRFHKNLIMDENHAVRGRSSTRKECVWMINEYMIKKFGDGKIYTFTQLVNTNNYTHRCLEDGCYYHEDWIQPEELLNAKRFTNPKPESVDPSSLDIPEA